MFRRRRRKVCGYWECHKRIPTDDFLCAEHSQGWVDGIIDRCPKCGRFKDVAYRLCLDCYFGREVPQWQPPVEIPPQKRSYRIEYSDVWVDAHYRPDRFFVFIIEFDDGNLYVGHTADLGKQFSEFRDTKVSSASVPPPKLQYMQVIATRRAAELREVELKKLIETNPDQIRLMMSDFRNRMHELGFEQDF